MFFNLLNRFEFTVIISVSRRIIPFPSGSCLGKLECVKANSIEVANILIIIIFPQCNLNILTLFAFTRFYLRVLAVGNGIILRLNRSVILKKANSLPYTP